MSHQAPEPGLEGAECAPESTGGYTWPEGKRSAVVISVDIDADSPRLWQTRDQPSDLMAELEQRRFGPRQGVRRLVELFTDLDIPATFFAPCSVLERNLYLLDHIGSGRFEIGSHGYFHELVANLGESENRDLIGRQIGFFEKELGRAPTGYRAPAWELTPSVHRMLKEFGFLYDSSLMGFDHPYSIEGLVEIPVEWSLDDGVYFRFIFPESAHSRLSDPASVLDAWIEEFEASRHYGGLFVLTLHDWISGRGPRARLIGKLLGHIKEAKDVWIATAQDIARYHAGSSNYERFSRQSAVGF